MKAQLKDMDVFDGDDPFHQVPTDLRHLIPGFLDRREREIVDLLEFLSHQDFESIKEIGHRLKGTGAGYGFQVISNLGQDLEEAALEEDLERAKKSVEQLTMITMNLRKMLTLRFHS